MHEREQLLAAYESWLLRQSLAKNPQEAYRFHVRQYGEYLVTRPATRDDPLHHPFARDYAVRDYKLYLKTERKAKPASVNLALAAIDHFYRVSAILTKGACYMRTASRRRAQPFPLTIWLKP